MSQLLLRPPPSIPAQDRRHYCSRCDLLSAVRIAENGPWGFVWQVIALQQGTKLSGSNAKKEKGQPTLAAPESGSALSKGKTKKYIGMNEQHLSCLSQTTKIKDL